MFTNGGPFSGSSREFLLRKTSTKNTNPKNFFFVSSSRKSCLKQTGFFVEKKPWGFDPIQWERPKKNPTALRIFEGRPLCFATFQDEMLDHLLLGDDYAIFIYSTSNLVCWRKISTQPDWDVMFMSLRITLSDVGSSEVHFSVHPWNLTCRYLKGRHIWKEIHFQNHHFWYLFVKFRGGNWVHFIHLGYFLAIRSTFTKMR